MPAVSTRSGFGSSHSISGLIAVEPQSARNRPGTDERSIPGDESDRLPDQAGFARCRAQESRIDGSRARKCCRSRRSGARSAVRPDGVDICRKPVDLRVQIADVRFWSPTADIGRCCDRANSCPIYLH